MISSFSLSWTDLAQFFKFVAYMVIAVAGLGLLWIWIRVK